MHGNTGLIRRSRLPDMTRLDGRYRLARRIKSVMARLKSEVAAGRRWTNAELDLLKRTATAVVLSEEASRRALRGELPVVDAVKASGSARRHERDLRLLVVRKPAPEPTLAELHALGNSP